MKKLIHANMLWNTAFVLMALAEMLGMTAVHQDLPWYLKWWWICGLAGGNLFIHVLQLRHIDANTKRSPGFGLGI